MKAAVLLLVLAMLLVAPACSGSRTAPAARPPVAATTPPKPRAPTPAPPVAAPLPVTAASGWTDLSVSNGGWQYESDGTISRALFGDNPFRPAMVIACNRGQGWVGIAVRGTPPGPRRMEILTETAQRAMTAANQPEVDGVAATLAPGDPLLDAMALSKGRFAVAVEGASMLIVPSYAEVSRVIEDCRG
jgi:hypothetical protein